jgi:hypothetical protein
VNGHSRKRIVIISKTNLPGREIVNPFFADSKPLKTSPCPPRRGVWSILDSIISLIALRGLSVVTYHPFVLCKAISSVIYVAEDIFAKIDPYDTVDKLK